MATLGQIGNFYNAQSGILLERFLGGVLKEIVVIKNEAANTAGHAARLVWADAKANSSKAELLAEAERQMRLAIAGNATIQASMGESSDSDIEYVINQQVNADIA